MVFQEPFEVLKKRVNMEINKKVQRPNMKRIPRYKFIKLSLRIHKNVCLPKKRIEYSFMDENIKML